MIYLSIFLFLYFLWVVMKPQNIGSFSKEATLPLRGVLALLIVFHHISLRLTYMVPKDAKVNYLRDFSDWGEPIVSVFFFLSGYGIIKSYQKKGKSYLEGFFSGRLLRLMVPFIICCICYYPFNNYTFSSIISLEKWKLDCPFLPSSWFVIAIFVLYLLFYISARLFPKVGLTIAFAWVLSISLMIVLEVMGFKTFWWHNIIALNVGMSISFHEDILRKLLLNRKALILFFCFLLFSLYTPLVLNISDKCLFLPRVILLPIFVWQLICYRKYNRMSLLDWLGNISYEVYLVHVAILSFLFGFIGGHPILLIILTYVLSLMCAYALNQLVRKIA